MISVGGLPIHGACVSLTLKDHRQKNIILIGDSGAGKSETLEALRKVAADYVIDMTTIFDDMGTLVIEDGQMKAYGTEIGAFVRTDDLENGYTYSYSNTKSILFDLASVITSFALLTNIAILSNSILNSSSSGEQSHTDPGL